jgi:hypothetical protein
MAYGDHQPSLAAAFASLGLRDSRTDYLIWNTDAGAPPAPAPHGLAAHELAAALLGAMGATAAASQTVPVG